MSRLYLLAIQQPATNYETVQMSYSSMQRSVRLKNYTSIGTSIIHAYN